MGKIVPFYAVDQPLVDRLCSIIQSLETVLDVAPDLVIHDADNLELFTHITTVEQPPPDPLSYMTYPDWESWKFPDGPWGWNDDGTSKGTTSADRYAHVNWYHDTREDDIG